MGLVMLLMPGDPFSIDAVARWVIGSAAGVALALAMAAGSLDITVPADSLDITAAAVLLSAVALVSLGLSMALTGAALALEVTSVYLAHSLLWGSPSDDIDPLDAEKTTDACMELDRCARKDAAVRVYLMRVSAMGRAPVIGEYQAAKAWVANQAARDAHRVVREAELAKIAQARAVCAAWASPPNTGTEIQDEATKT